MLIAYIFFLHSAYSSCNAAVVPPASNIEIIGGDDIHITEAPYQVALIQNDWAICGGVLVANDTVLTASHCVWRNEKYVVRIGSDYNSQGGELHDVKKILMHPNYMPSNNPDYDLAIIWLSQPVIFSNKVAAIDMKKSDEEIPDGDLVQVTGWGRTEPIEKNKSEPLILQRVMLPKVNDQECSKKYKKNADITPRMLCAGYPEGGKDSCAGDSGGPLVHDGKLAGLVSWGFGCALAEYPGVYSKISAMRSWIDENISKKYH